MPLTPPPDGPRPPCTRDPRCQLSEWDKHDEHEYPPDPEALRAAAAELLALAKSADKASKHDHA